MQPFEAFPTQLPSYQPYAPYQPYPLSYPWHVQQSPLQFEQSYNLQKYNPYPAVSQYSPNQQQAQQAPQSSQQLLQPRQQQQPQSQPSQPSQPQPSQPQPSQPQQHASHSSLQSSQQSLKSVTQSNPDSHLIPSPSSQPQQQGLSRRKKSRSRSRSRSVRKRSNSRGRHRRRSRSRSGGRRRSRSSGRSRSGSREDNRTSEKERRSRSGSRGRGKRSPGQKRRPRSRSNNRRGRSKSRDRGRTDRPSRQSGWSTPAQDNTNPFNKNINGGESGEFVWSDGRATQHLTSGGVVAQRPARNSIQQSWRQVEGGLAALASRYGQHNDAATVREAKDLDWLDHDDDFKLPLAPPSEDFDFTGIRVVTASTPIEDTNLGFRLLLKLGWKKDGGLGAKAQGITAPILVSASSNNGSMGLGKDTEFAETAAAATQERRKLRSEQLLNETKQEGEKRQEEEVRQQTIAADVRDTLAVFNCKLCKAQYATSEQWDEHLSSYQHHHRVRFQETRRLHAARSMNGQQERDDILAEKALEAQMKAAHTAAAKKEKAERSALPPVVAVAVTSIVTSEIIVSSDQANATTSSEAPMRAPLMFGGMNLGAGRKLATAFSFSGKAKR